jgi:2,4-didehydro-3-deoxy-L-rhamnonate hydrolase
MRLANLNERLVLITDDGAIDVERSSGGRFHPDPQAVFESWDELLVGESTTVGSAGAQPYGRPHLRAPVPRPRQVFALALNDADHAAEGGRYVPTELLTFTKFPTCLIGLDATVSLVRLTTSTGRSNSLPSSVGGLTASLRTTRGRTSRFGPIGPWLVTPDELPDPDDLAIGCVLNGEQVQDGRTSDMVFGVAQTISRLSLVCPLPGDLVFTGTPSGVGNARDPKWFLKPGDEMVSTIEGVGSITTHFEARAGDRGRRGGRLRLALPHHRRRAGRRAVLGRRRPRDRPRWGRRGPRRADAGAARVRGPGGEISMSAVFRWIVARAS